MIGFIKNLAQKCIKFVKRLLGRTIKAQAEPETPVRTEARRLNEQARNKAPQNRKVKHQGRVTTVAA